MLGYLTPLQENRISPSIYVLSGYLIDLVSPIFVQAGIPKWYNGSLREGLTDRKEVEFYTLMFWPTRFFSYLICHATFKDQRFIYIMTNNYSERHSIIWNFVSHPEFRTIVTIPHSATPDGRAFKSFNWFRTPTFLLTLDIYSMCNLSCEFICCSLRGINKKWDQVSVWLLQ